MKRTRRNSWSMRTFPSDAASRSSPLGIEPTGADSILFGSLRPGEHLKRISVPLPASTVVNQLRSQPRLAPQNHNPCAGSSTPSLALNKRLRRKGFSTYRFAPRFDAASLFTFRTSPARNFRRRTLKDSGSRVSHSHSTRTRHPCFLSSRSAIASRVTLRANLVSQ